jgi:hypothetical protein
VFLAKLNPSGSSLLYSTYLGGSGLDQIGPTGLAVDVSGNAYLVGATTSTDFPTLNPYQAAYGGGDQDAFVTKLNASGNGLVYSTYLGGTSGEHGYAITVDASGNAYATGDTYSTDFPTLNAYQGVNNLGPKDAFVTKLNAAGNGLLYSTFLGGAAGYEEPRAVAVDSSGNAYVAGFTTASDFPTLNPFQGTYGGVLDGFVTKLNAAGNALVYSTFIGGSNEDYVQGLGIDQSGNAFLVGITSSSNFPTKNPYQGSYQGGSYDGFVTAINSTGNDVIFSTYLGGNGSDKGLGIAVDQTGSIYLAGETYSTNFPLKNPIQGSYQGGGDIFVCKFHPSGNALAYSTYLGGTGEDRGRPVKVNQGEVHIVGFTASTNFPLQKPYQATYGGGTYDAFVAKISPVTKAKMIYFSPVHNLKE